MAEDIAEALCKIDEHIEDCYKDLELFYTEEMRGLVGELYAAIFKYLTTVSTWLTQKKRKRLISSFDENLRNMTKGELETVQDKSDRIKACATRATQKAVKVGFDTSFEMQKQRLLIDVAQAQGLSELKDMVAQLLKMQARRNLDDQQAALSDGRRVVPRSVSPSTFSIEEGKTRRHREKRSFY